MNIQNIKKMKSEKGFTIVELLIVIVVIGILAAIVIVAYQGVTARANLTKAKTNAATVQKKAEAYAADTGNGSYPTLTTQFAGAISGLPTGITLLTGSQTLGNGNGTTAVKYQSCDSGAGYRITWWDFSTTPAAESTGTLTGGTTVSCAVPAT